MKKKIKKQYFLRHMTRKLWRDERAECQARRITLT